MKTDVVRNLRLVLAASLVTVWAYSHLVRTPLLGDSMIPLLLALLVAPGVAWHGTRTYRFVALALVGLVVLTALLYWAGTETALQGFAHSPWFVVPLGALALFGLVRNAVSAERSAVAAQSAAAAARATGAG